MPVLKLYIDLHVPEYCNILEALERIRVKIWKTLFYISAIQQLQFKLVKCSKWPFHYSKPIKESWNCYLTNVCQCNSVKNYSNLILECLNWSNIIIKDKRHDKETSHTFRNKETFRDDTFIKTTDKLKDVFQLCFKAFKAYTNADNIGGSYQLSLFPSRWILPAFPLSQQPFLSME